MGNRIEHADPGRPITRDHIVQLYEADTYLLQSLADFVGEGLRAGEACLVLATESHRLGLETMLESANLDLRSAADQGRYVALDARELLSAVVRDGMVDPVLFTTCVGALVKHTADRFARVRIFGELVALLCEAGNHAAAIALEEHWNALQRTCSFSLFCAYPITNFQGASLAPSLAHVCEQHGHVIPAESYTQLGSDEKQLREVVLLQQKAVSLEAEQKRREAALTRSIRLRDDFLSAISHDLKTPITILQGQAQLLQHRLVQGNADPESLRQGLKQIESRSRTMAKLVDELLDVAHLRAGEDLRLDRRSCDLVSLVSEAIQSQRDTASTCRLTWVCAEAEMVGWWDRKRLVRVVENLIDNAIKYSPDGGEVTITLTREATENGDLAVLYVQDRGIGIPEDDLPHVFEHLYRGANVAREAVGSGIGLSGARRIIEQHGGGIEVRSRQGEGSTFTVRLPVR